MADRLRLAGRELVLGLAARAGLTLLLEDLQWADDDSLSLLEELAERLQDRRLLLVATGRPELLERQPTPFAGGKVLQIEPQGLLLPDVGRLATLVAGRPLPPELVRSIAERTQGSPLFVEHIVLALPEVRRAGEGPSALPLPLTVEAAVQSRLDHLPYEEREILKRAALLRRPFLAEEIEALGADDAEAGLAALVRRDLVSFKSGERQDRRRRYRIKSVLVADVAYLMMARPLRADLHRRAAQYLADRQSAGPEELAVHYERGGEQVQAARAYTRAALNAAARGDSAGVLRNGDRALALGVEPGVLFGLRMARAEALRFLGRREEQKLELEAALARARTEAERAFALAEQSWWLAAHGQAAEALAHAETAVSAARACGDATVLARALGRQVVALIHTGQLDAAGHCLSEATRLTADASLQLRALAQGWRAQLATAKGDLGERRDAFQTACWLYQRAGDVRSAAGAEANLADVHNRLGAYGEAEVALAHAIEGCRRVGHREMEAYAHLNRAYALAMLARHGEAAGSLEQARAIADPLGKRRLSVAVALYAAKLSLLSARTGSAAAEAEAAERSAASAALPALAVSARVVRAQAYLSQGSASEARALAEQALAERDRLGGLEEDDAELFLVLSRALDALGLPREARRIARRGEQALEAVALGISDASLREQYRNGVAAHRALVDRAAQG